jgi:hypothetical protein
MKTQQPLIIIAFISAAMLSGCSRNLQISLEKAVHNKDGAGVEALLGKGADAFSVRGKQPSIFKEAVFAAMDDNVRNGAHGPGNPAYAALCRKWRSSHPPVEKDLTLQVSIVFGGINHEGRAQLTPLITGNHGGVDTQISFARDETVFHGFIISSNGYAISVVNGDYRIKGRLVNGVIEAESVEFLGVAEEMDSAMLIPISRFLPSTVKLHRDSFLEYIEWKSMNKPQVEGETMHTP